MPKEAPNPCCQREDNMLEIVTPNPEKPELTYRMCRVCRARHFRLKADPGIIGLRGIGMGEELPDPRPIIRNS